MTYVLERLAHIDPGSRFPLQFANQLHSQHDNRVLFAEPLLFGRQSLLQLEDREEHRQNDAAYDKAHHADQQGLDQ